MPNPFAMPSRAHSDRPITWRVWLSLVAVPVIVVGTLAWAFWAPFAGNGTAKAAVVNNDEPAKVNGQPAPLGRELAAKLVNSTDSGYSWEVTDDEDARDKLDSGEYAAVVTIPKDFSSKAVTSMSGEPRDATQGRVDVRSSPTARPVDASATMRTVRQSVARFNDQVVGMYLNGLLGGFSQMHDQMGKVSGGVDQLTDGSEKLAGGNAQLAEGAGGLADGASKLNEAAQKLSGGADELATGVNKLSDGSGQLAGGMTQLEKQTAQLPEMTQKLADGAQQVANGNRQLADTLVPLLDQIIKVLDALPTTTQSNDRVAELSEHCQAELTPQFCAELKAAATKLDEANKVNGLLEELRKGAIQTRDAMQGLAHGAEQVAAGNQALADKTPQLAGGIGALAGGARQLDGGIGQLGGGAQQLADGTGQLAGGIGQFAGGAEKLAGGADQLTGGADQLAQGVGKLSGGLEQAGDKIPHYSDADREHLMNVAPSPAAFDHTGTGFGKSIMGLLLALALWAGALATYLVTRAVPSRLVASRAATWKIVARSAVPGATAAAATAVALSVVLAPFLGLSFVEWSAFFGIALLAAMTFVAVNQALRAFFKQWGTYVSVGVLVLTLAAGVISTVPGALTSVAGVLPTSGAIQAMGSVITGGTGVGLGIVQLVLWLVVGVIAAIVGTERERALSAKQLRFA